MLNDVTQDAVHALRSLRRTPAFALTALLTLALGIGANTAIFSVINAVLLRPLPFASPDQLVFVWSSTNAFPRAPLTPGRLIDFREQMSNLSAVAGISHLSVNLTGQGDPERISGSSVSSNFFDLLGASPLLGDAFHDGRADEREVVLSYGLWSRRFGSDPHIVGREVVLNGTARRVAAVMPREFEWPGVTSTGSSNAGGPELWIPAARHDVPRTPRDYAGQDLSGDRSTGYLRAVARLKDGVTVEQAQREAEAVAHRLAAQFPRTDSGLGAAIQPLREQFFGVVRQPLLVLLAAVTVVLGIACANAASLLLGRASERRREIAVKFALGASRGRIIRQLLTESTLLSLGGAGLGLLLAWWTGSWLVATAPDGILRLESSRLDGSVLTFTFSVAIVTGLLFGIIPAWQVSRTAPTDGMADGGPRGSAGRRATRTRDTLVAAQICVSLVLLVGAGLLLRSFATLSRVDTGIDPRHLLAFDIVLSGVRAQDASRRAPFYDELLGALRALPGVGSAGAAVTLPIGGDDFSAPFTVEGRAAASPAEEPTAGYQIVTPGYFETMGMTIRAGRDFSPSDTPDSGPVVLINETLARQQWPGVDPVGRRLHLGRSSTGPWKTVIGVVSDIRHLGPATAPRPELYEVHTQSPFSFMAFVVRTSNDPYALVPSIRAAVTRLDPSQPVSGVRTMDEHLARSLARPRFMSTLTAAFGVLALTLAIVGLYGLMSYSVTQRTREIAIRSALGARRMDLMRLVLGKALGLAIIGVTLGTLAAMQVAGLLTGMLFGVTPIDPWTYTAAAALLIAVALAAGVVPAFRALRIDGAQALRN
jgi:putative ABC transport system permease protein